MTALECETPNPLYNQLLAALPAPEYERLLPSLEHVALPRGKVLCGSGVDSDYAYFPVSGIVSLLYDTRDGTTTQTAMSGCEGLIGIGLFAGGEASRSRAVVQTAGAAYRLHGSVLNREFARGGLLQHLVMRYTLALIAQTGQTAACNRHHTVEQQLCRWLLACLDRLPSSGLSATHESIASNLGVRRESITLAAQRLQRTGVIDYHRSHITVLGRRRLEVRACECYAVVKKEYDRLLGGAAAGHGHM
jgi:CRP-like cAMP-binding protein